MTSSDSSDVDSVLSAYFRRDDTLAQAAPDDFTIDQYHPDIEDLDPAGYLDTVVEQKLGSAFFAQADLASPGPPVRSSTCSQCPSLQHLLSSS